MTDIIIKVLIGFVILNLTVFAVAFRRPRTKWRHEVYDCAVVCGYFANEDGSASEIMKTRVKRAVDLCADGKVKHLILSGGAVYNRFRESEVMKNYALELGTDKAVITEEKRAVSTYHNLLYSSQIMEQNQWKNCVVVTSRWHLRKADHYARRFCPDSAMVSASDPCGQTWTQGVLLAVKTGFNMYRNLFRGYY